MSALVPFPASCILGSTWPCLPSPLCCYLPCLAPLLPGHLRSERKKGTSLRLLGPRMTRNQDCAIPPASSVGLSPWSLDVWGAPLIPTVRLAPLLPQFQSGISSEPRTVLAPEGASGDQTWSPGTCSPVATAVPLSRGTKADLEGVVLPGLSWLSGVYWEDHQGPLFCALLNPGVCVGD